MTGIPSQEIAERAILGLLLNGETSLAEIEALGITPDHFHCHRMPYEEIVTFAENGGGDINELLIQAREHNRLEEIGGAAFYTDAKLSCVVGSLPSYTRALRHAHGQRLVIQASLTLAKEPTNAEAHSQITAGKTEIDLGTSAARSLPFECIHHSDLADSEGAFDFVEDLLTDGAASVIYGASNSGKTFFAIDLGAHVATGRNWQEKEVEQGAVIYIALEGEQGAKNRIKAMQRRGILPEDAPFFLCFSPVNLLDPTHPETIKRTIESASDTAGLPVRLIIIDTLARAMAGGDENSGKDMGEAVKTIDAVRKSTGAHVCIIHHCGKNLAKGARGHSSLRAAIDTEIEVIHPQDDKYRTATVVKQRDLAIMTPLVFSLEPVEVGINPRGKPITSCVVKEESSIMAHVKGKAGAPLKYNSEMLLDLLPQLTIKAWQEAANKAHGMGKDSFDDHRRKCATRWEKTKQGVIVKSQEPISGIKKGGNRGNCF